MQMAIYAAVIEEVDRSIGRVVEHLKEKGVLDNTLIILLSDNGGNVEYCETKQLKVCTLDTVVGAFKMCCVHHHANARIVSDVLDTLSFLLGHCSFSLLFG